MGRKTWILALTGWVAFTLAVAILVWYMAAGAPRQQTVAQSELEAELAALESRLSKAEATLTETEGQLKAAQQQLATTQRYLDMAEKWADGLSWWGPLYVLYWNDRATQIGPPVQESRWWNYENVGELLFQMRGALLAARDLRQVDPSQDAILSREVVSSPILTAPLEGYQWVGLEFQKTVEIHAAGQSVDSQMVLLFFPDGAGECSIYLHRADGAWLKAVAAHDAEPLRQWIQKLYNDKGPYD